jgi:DNA-binding PucR family transcriptional regulator
MEASAPEPLAERIAHALTALVAGGVLPEPPFVTWSDVVDQPDAVARSYRRALAASRVAEMMQPAGGLRLGWDDLGVYQTLVQVPADELGRSSIDLRIGRLADKPELLQTLETYLELAGDAKRATDELSVHRATLYYRLSKVEQLAEIDLKSGADRFGAYLAIKALRLAGDLT